MEHPSGESNPGYCLSECRYASHGWMLSGQVQLILRGMTSKASCAGNFQEKYNAYRGPHTPDLNRTNCKNMGVSFHRPVNQQPVVKFDKPVLTEFDSEPSQFLLVCSLNLSDDSFPVLRRPTLVLQGILQRFLTDRMVCFMVHVIPPRHTDARATGTWFSGFFR